MKFEGESFHENVIEFYREASDWLKGFLETDFSEFVFDCELKYFNSSTGKLLFNMLLKMDETAATGKNISVNWITTEDNDIIIEWGEDFREDMTNLRFAIVFRDN